MKHQINLVHLKYFCDAAIYASISEAAKINYVSQSAISQAIAKLEICLGIRLLNHARQKFHMTEEGQIVFEESRKIFKAVQNIHDKINRNQQTLTGTLKFVSTNSLGMSFIAHLYKNMLVNYPGIQMNYRLGGLNFIRNALKQGDAEFAIIVYDKNFSQFEKHFLKKGLFHLYHHIEASPHQIENGILVDDFKGMFVQELCESFAQLNGSPLKIQAELAGWEVVARFTEMNIGVGFFPDYIMDNNRYPTLKIYPLNIPLFEYEICAIYNKGEKLSRAVYAFLEQFSLD